MTHLVTHHAHGACSFHFPKCFKFSFFRDPAVPAIPRDLDSRTTITIDRRKFDIEADDLVIPTYFTIKFKYLNVFFFFISFSGGDLRVGQGGLRGGREDAPQADRNHPGSQGKGGKVHFWCSFVFFSPPILRG